MMMRIIIIIVIIKKPSNGFKAIPEVSPEISSLLSYTGKIAKMNVIMKIGLIGFMLFYRRYR